MKQIKVFTTSENNISPKVNEWLKDNKDKKISDIQFAISRAESTFSIIRGVMIIFEEGGKK